MSTVVTIARAVAEAVAASADELNRLDGQAGDGDLGITMQAAASIVCDRLPELDGRPLHEQLQQVGLALARGAPSTAGTLVATGLLRAAAASTSGIDQSPAATFAALLRAAADGIAERGKAEVGSRTMLDALVPAADEAEASAESQEPIARTLRRAADAADRGARETAQMRAVHGRAGWLADRAAGHEDAGARLVAIALRAAADATGSPDVAAKEREIR